MDLGRRVLKGVLEVRDARLPDATKQDGRVWRRRKATPKTISTDHVSNVLQIAFTEVRSWQVLWSCDQPSLEQERTTP